MENDLTYNLNIKENNKEIKDLNMRKKENEYNENFYIKSNENSIDLIEFKENKNFKIEYKNNLDSYNDLNYNRKYSRSNDKKKIKNQNTIFPIDQMKKNNSEMNYSDDFDKLFNQGLEVLNRGDSNIVNQFNRFSLKRDLSSKDCEISKNEKEEANDNLKNDLILNFDPNDKNFNYKMTRNQTVQIIKEGILKKKSPWFHYNTRKIVLDSTPRIEYIDPILNKVKVKIL